MNALLQVECKNCNPISEFLDDRCDHDRSKAYGISGDDEKRNLPRQCCRDKAIVEAGMRDRWRISASDEIENEKQRGDYQHAPNASYQEDNLCEFHRQTFYAD